MELVEGGTLRELLRERGPMPPHAVAAVLRPVLGGLAVAHRAGLVHRDIKPENVLISDDGEVKIADFGLVRAIAEAGITSTSVILGTAAYLSPEQVSSGDADPRSDVYAVGILAYELLTGATPFTGDTALAVAYQRMDNDVPPPSSAIGGVPPQFDEFIARATARDPDDRYRRRRRDGRRTRRDRRRTGPARSSGCPRRRTPPSTPRPPRTTAGWPTAPTTAAHVTAGEAPDPSARPRARGLAARARTAVRRRATNTTSAPRQFAGIDIDDFAWARQRARRAVVFWVLAVLILTGLVAAGAWTLGTNLQSLIGQSLRERESSVAQHLRDQERQLQATAGCSAADRTPSRSGRPGRCRRCPARHRGTR